MQLTCWWLFAVWSLALAHSDPGPVRESPSSDPGSCGPSGCGGNISIPLNVAWKLSGARDIDDLIEHYIINKEDYYKSLADDSGLATRIDDAETFIRHECIIQTDCLGLSGTSCVGLYGGITRCLCGDNFPPVDGICVPHSKAAIDDNERSKRRDCEIQTDCAGISGTSCVGTHLGGSRCLCGDNLPPIDGKCIPHSNVEVARIPLCVPQPTVVPVKPEVAILGSLILPSCIRVDRCNGCCDSPIMECIPTKTEEQLFRIAIFHLNDDIKLIFKRFIDVKEDKHLQCKCACKLKAEHCNALQAYNPETCRCECTTSADEQNACNSKSDRRWDQFTCTCQCLGDTECSTNSEYDKNLCRCVKLSVIPLDQ